jgi:hypothetical protein
MIVVTLATASWFGYETVTAFTRNRWNFLTRVFSGYPFGVIAQSFLALILQYYIPWGLLHLTLVLSIMLLISVCLHLLSSRFHPSLVIRITLGEVIFLTVAMAFSVFRLTKIYFEDGMWTRGAAYSDFSFHTQLVTSFAIGYNTNRTSLFGFETIMSAGSPLAYPVLVNFHSAFLLADCDVSIPRAMKYPALLVGVCFVFQIYALALRFTNGDSVASLLSIPLWAFSGGLGCLGALDYGKPPVNSNVDYISVFYNGQHAFWFQSMTHIFHPQRSATFAMPLCYIAMNALLTGIDRFEWQFFALAALIVGLTPQTQIHAYVALAVFSVALAVFTFPVDGRWLRSVKCWVLYGILANTIALPLCVPFLRRTEQSSEFFQVRPIWENREFVKASVRGIRAFSHLWWTALGPFAVIALLLGYATATIQQIRIYLAAISVFLLSSIVMFQPWELDNCKVFQDGWLPIALGFVGQYFTIIWRSGQSIVIKLTLVIVFVSTIASGMVNVFTYERYPLPLYLPNDAETGRWAAESFPMDTILHAPNDEVMIPPACYAGRRLLSGYRGWLSSHGLANTSRDSLDLRHGDGLDPWLARQNGVEYMLMIDKGRTLGRNREGPNWKEWNVLMEYPPYAIFGLQPRKTDPLPRIRQVRTKTVKRRTFSSR